jgi:hypothetical protein
MAGPHIDVSVNDAESIMFPNRAASKRIRNAADQSAMTEEEIEVADIIADAPPLQLLDAAYAL